jgi:translation elongation factor EF-Tu-like GTPase
MVKRKTTSKKIAKSKKTSPKKTKKKTLTTKSIKPKEKLIGIVTHYFPKVSAGVVKLKASLALGDNIRIKGHTTDFTQTVTSIQINHLPIKKAKKGQEIGLLVNSRVRKNDLVYKI